MYLPPHFADVSPEAAAETIRRAPLACVVAQTADGLVANHLPLHLSSDGTLIGHVALANDLHRQLDDGQEVLAVFRRDDAYVSPRFYPSKAETHRVVPTWNYEVVHVHGRIAFQHDDKAKRAAVGMLTRDAETRLNGRDAWRMADAPADFIAERLSRIVALRIVPGRVIAKAKLSQNRDRRDAQGVATGLRGSGHAQMADRIEARLTSGD